MNAALATYIRQTLRPLVPLPTGERSRLVSMPEVRAVLFDVYGTLLVSCSGELELAPPDEDGRPLADALTALAIHPPSNCGEAIGWLHEAIRFEHAAARMHGVEWPEVDIRRIWKSVWERWRAAEPDLPREMDFERLALEYEVRANPVWPMPHAGQCLDELRRHGVTVGLVSNAQFFTPWVLESLLGAAFAELAATAELQFLSYQHGRAKPSTFLFRLASEQLKRRGIAAHEVLYVGNDMRNDIGPASQTGFRTALFAGDRRSLRWRHGHAGLEAYRPDLVLVELHELLTCLFPDAPQRT